MIILVDTNVVLDVLMKREPYTEAAQHILTKCANREIVGYLAAHSIPNLFYILRKAYSQKERRKFIKNLCDIVPIGFAPRLFWRCPCRGRPFPYYVPTRGDKLRKKE